MEGSAGLGASEGRYPVCAVCAKLGVLVQGCNHKEGCLSLTGAQPPKSCHVDSKSSFLMLWWLPWATVPHLITGWPEGMSSIAAAGVAPRPTGQLPGVGRTAVTVLADHVREAEALPSGFVALAVRAVTVLLHRAQVIADTLWKRTTWSDALTRPTQKIQTVRKSTTSNNRHFLSLDFNLEMQTRRERNGGD